MDNPKQVLIYDLRSIPSEGSGLDMERIMQLYNEHNVLLYDGTDGDKPEIINIEDIDITFIDVSKEEGMKKWNNYKKKIK